MTCVMDFPNIFLMVFVADVHSRAPGGEQDVISSGVVLRDAVSHVFVSLVRSMCSAGKSPHVSLRRMTRVRAPRLWHV